MEGERLSTFLEDEYEFDQNGKLVRIEKKTIDKSYKKPEKKSEDEHKKKARFSLILFVIIIALALLALFEVYLILFQRW